jgi:hypothetical protein
MSGGVVTEGSFATRPFGFIFLGFIFSLLVMPSSAHALARMAAPAAVDSAEICTSFDDQFMTIVSFGDARGTLVMYNADPTKKPRSKDGFSFKKIAGGVSRKSEVSIEMFEMMAEPFGATLKPRALWKKAYEILFRGNVAFIDEQGKQLAVVPMNCSAAMVEYL